ncbi:helix-turn-helix domain-containing protein [bacterium]|nr:helix-turn-helix domain-containing protein [bacterium]
MNQTPKQPTKPGSLKKWNQAIKKSDVTRLPLNKLKDVDPERYACVIQLLREGVGLKAIQRSTGTSTATLYRIMNEDPSLNAGMDVLSGKLKRHANHALDRLNEILEENPEQISYRDLSVSMGVATDKIEKLHQTQAHRTVSLTQVNINEARDINALLAGLPAEATEKPSKAISKAMDVIEAEELKEA